MKSLICAASVMLVLCSSAAMASIGPVTLYLDTAPNVYGRPLGPPSAMRLTRKFMVAPLSISRTATIPAMSTP